MRFTYWVLSLGWKRLEMFCLGEKLDLEEKSKSHKTKAGRPFSFLCLWSSYDPYYTPGYSHANIFFRVRCNSIKTVFSYTHWVQHVYRAASYQNVGEQCLWVSLEAFVACQLCQSIFEKNFFVFTVSLRDFCYSFRLKANMYYAWILKMWIKLLSAFHLVHLNFKTYFSSL